MAAWFARRYAAVAGPTDVIHNIRLGREHLSWASYRLARRRGVPFFITPNFSPRMQTRSGRFLMRNLFELLRRADGVFVFTPAEFEALQRLGVGAERLCEIGVGPLLSETHDAEGFRKAHGINGRMVLFLGQKLPYKGFDTLIAAAPLVWRSFPDTHFVFMGPHYDRSPQIIQSLGDRRVVDIPRVDPFDPLKTSALAAADVFALPSRQEGIGGVYIEAWAMKKPVIACRIPFLSIRDGVDGFLVPQEAPALAERIIELLAHPDRARAMGEAGYNRVQTEYNWDSIVDRIEKFYERAVRQRANASLK